MKTLDAVDGFHLLENSHKLCRGFHQAMKARKTCFISLIKLLFFDDIQSAYVYFNFFHETLNSHNLETVRHIAHVIFVLHSAMKTHLMINQKCKFCPNYFIVLFRHAICCLGPSALYSHKIYCRSIYISTYIVI